MNRTIGIISGKGGVGKTTLAVNLGTAIANNFRRHVAVVDCNITTSHLGLHLGIYNYRSTLNKVLRNEHPMEDAIHHHHSGMKIIPSSLSIADLDGADISRLRASVERISSNHDVVLLDSAPGLGREAAAAIKASQEIIFVGTPHITSVVDIIKCHEIAHEAGAKPVGIVLNMIRKDRHEMTRKEVEHLTELPVIATIPFEKNMTKSLAMKTPIVTMKPRSKASREIVGLASKILMENHQNRRRFLRFF